MKKRISSLITGMLLLSMLAGCSGNNSSSGAPAGGSAPAPAAAGNAGSGGKENVTFWYNHAGDEALIYEQAIAAYNASQDKYQVTGLSVTDQQKLIVAMSSNEAPDVIKGSNQHVVAYQANGLMESLDSYIGADSYDTGIFSEQAVSANTIDGSVYALPLSAYTIQMFYNKDLLAAAGYSEPPKTMEEMYEMAVAATVLDANGGIEVLGYPLFPLASARQELIYGFGGRWWAEDGKTLTPSSQGVIDSLNMNLKYRELYGVGPVQAFVATANTNRYTEQDMFFAGKQLFRLDGSWLPTMMENFNSTVNYGITLIPGTAANPGLRGVSRFETDSVSMPIMAKNKAGAWDFIKWLTSEEGDRIILLGTGNLPALKSLYDDPDILAKPGFAEFIDALKEEKGIQYPHINDFSKYISLIEEHLDYVYNGIKTPETAMSEMQQQADTLQ